VEGLISNYQQLIDGYLRGSGVDKLAEGMTTLGGGFDGPIKDLAVLPQAKASNKLPSI
jgi:hypothetical protein